MWVGKLNLQQFHSSAASIQSCNLKARQQTLRGCSVVVLLWNWKTYHHLNVWVFFSLFAFLAEPVSVESDEWGGSEVCVRPRLHNLSAPSASTLCPISGSCCCQQPAGAGDALPGLRTQEGKTQRWTRCGPWRFGSFRLCVTHFPSTCLYAHYHFYCKKLKYHFIDFILGWGGKIDASSKNKMQQSE